jgi:DUF4097 and DUF4098 domain-containing protein YvlB
MNRFLTLRSWFLVVPSTLLVATLAFAETKKEPTLTHSLEPGGYVSLENLNGDVTIEGWKKHEVRIDAVKKGGKKNLERIKIVVSVDQWEGKGWVSIETQYPTFFGKSGSVDYTIKAPFDSILEDVELVNGDLTVTGITGYLSLGTVNGSITATGMAGNAWIQTVNGNLDLSFDKMEKGQAIDLESVNGAIAIQIPKKSNVYVDAETVNGNISSDFGLIVDKGQWVGSSMEGRVGSGGGRITVETVNGNIEIKKR